LLRTEHPQQFAEMQSQFVILKLDHPDNAQAGLVHAAPLAHSPFTEAQGSMDGHPAAIAEDAMKSSITESCKISEGEQSQLCDTKSFIGNATGLKSLGSAGHPDACGTECIFFFFRSGCKAGEDCRFCHEFHARKNMKKNRRMLRRLARENGVDASDLQVATDKDGAVRSFDQMTATTSDDLSLSRQLSPEPLRFCYGGRWPVNGSAEKLTLVVGQHVNIPVHVDMSYEVQNLLRHGFTFNAEPTLPNGLTVDGSTGLLSGEPLAPLAPCIHTFSIVARSTGDLVTASQTVPLASFQMIIRVVDLRQFNLSWCSVDSEATDSVTITLSLRHPARSCVSGWANETSEL